jgi:hypothetical protein
MQEVSNIRPDGRAMTRARIVEGCLVAVRDRQRGIRRGAPFGRIPAAIGKSISRWALALVGLRENEEGRKHNRVARVPEALRPRRRQDHQNPLRSRAACARHSGKASGEGPLANRDGTPNLTKSHSSLMFSICYRISSGRTSIGPRSKFKRAI